MIHIYENIEYLVDWEITGIITEYAAALTSLSQFTLTVQIIVLILLSLTLEYMYVNIVVYSF